LKVLGETRKDGCLHMANTRRSGGFITALAFRRRTARSVKAQIGRLSLKRPHSGGATKNFSFSENPANRIVEREDKPLAFQMDVSKPTQRFLASKKAISADSFFSFLDTLKYPKGCRIFAYFFVE